MASERYELIKVMSEKILQQQIGQRIKEMRLRRGLRQKDMADLGYGTRHYQKIEKGELNLTLKTLMKLATALDSEVLELLPQARKNENIFTELFYDLPFGIILWKLLEPQDPYSLVLFESNARGALAVYRDLPVLKGKKILEIFPKAAEQGVVQNLYQVIATGQSTFVPELIRHDEGFPLTVFSTRFVKCGKNLAAAVFTDITEEYLEKQNALRKQHGVQGAATLPIGEPSRIKFLEQEVNALLAELGRPPKY